MTTEIEAYQDIKNRRRSITARNAGLRMAGKADQQSALPDLPAKPMKYLLTDSEGGYFGMEYDKETAHEYAEERGYLVIALPFDKAM